MTISSTAARRRLIATGAVLALAVAGFAGYGHGQAMQPVTFIVVNNLFSTPGYVAAENGYWAKQGLNVNVKLTSSGRAVVQAVQAPHAPFAPPALPPPNPPAPPPRTPL